MPFLRKPMLLLILALLLGGLVSSSVYAQQATFATPRLVVNASFLNVRTGPGVQYSVLVTVVGGMELPVLGVARDLVWYQVATNAGVGWVNVEFTLARGDFTRVPFAEVGAVAVPNVVLNPGQGGGGGAPAAAAPVSSTRRRITGVSVLGGDLRVNPGEGQQNIRAGLVEDFNTVYAVLNGTNIRGEAWVQIAFSTGEVGWINKFVIRPIQCTASDFVVTVVQDNMGTGTGTEAYVIGVIGDMLRLELTDGQIRTVAAAATEGRPETVISRCTGAQAPAVAPAASMPTFAAIPAQAGNRVVVNTGRLNVRSGPGGNFSVIAQLTGGVELGIVGRAGDDEWYLVQGTFGQGWVDSEFVLFRGDFSGVPIIRDAYSGGAIVTAVTGGQFTNPGQGGGMAPPVTVPTIVTNNRIVVNTGNLNVRSGPGGDFSILTSVPGGTELSVLGRAPDGVWFLVQGGFGQGWINIEFGIFRGDFASVPVIGN
ncbi:MAG: SH3 domain-containing protein [Anaerolineae bacterium]|jgi:uncharacterized protein YgiM (DUF1202 family)|nr:SH3 domain-containing protein [Anaerolineae bacterium]